MMVVVLGSTPHQDQSSDRGIHSFDDVSEAPPRNASVAWRGRGSPREELEWETVPLTGGETRLMGVVVRVVLGGEGGTRTHGAVKNNKLTAR